MKSRRILPLAVVAVVAVLALAGCVPTNPTPTPSPSALVGEWTHGNTRLELDPDGTFTLNQVPTGVVKQTEVAVGADPKGPLVDVTGSWHIGSGGNDAGGAPGVQLDFEKPAQIAQFTGLTLLVSAQQSPRLFVYLGDPDARYAWYLARG